MHYAALLGESRRDQAACGWPTAEEPHDWERMVSGVTKHIRASNWSIKVALNDTGVKYFNAFARFLDSELAKRRFIAGDNFSIADITTCCAADFARAARIEFPAELTYFTRWRAEVGARPGASA